MAARQAGRCKNQSINNHNLSPSFTLLVIVAERNLMKPCMYRSLVHTIIEIKAQCVRMRPLSMTINNCRVVREASACIMILNDLYLYHSPLTTHDTYANPESHGFSARLHFGYIASNPRTSRAQMT